VYMHRDPPGYARATNCMYRPEMQRTSCRDPAKMIAFDHGSAPIEVLDKCDTIEPGSGYCCPQYAMPRNWRTDFLPLGQEDIMPDVIDQGYLEEAQLYEADARLAAGKWQEAPEAFTDEAQEVYDYIVKYGNIAATKVGTATTTAAVQVAKTVDPAVESTRTGIRKHPLLAVGLGIVAGAIIARWFAGRR
jgi:hypothetical protein